MSTEENAQANKKNERKKDRPKLEKQQTLLSLSESKAIHTEMNESPETKIKLNKNWKLSNLYCSIFTCM